MSAEAVLAGFVALGVALGLVAVVLMLRAPRIPHNRTVKTIKDRVNSEGQQVGVCDDSY